MVTDTNTFLLSWWPFLAFRWLYACLVHIRNCNLKSTHKKDFWIRCSSIQTSSCQITQWLGVDIFAGTSKTADIKYQIRIFASWPTYVHVCMYVWCRKFCFRCRNTCRTYDPQFLFVPLYKKHEVIQVALSSPHIWCMVKLSTSKLYMVTTYVLTIEVNGVKGLTETYTAIVCLGIWDQKEMKRISCITFLSLSLSFSP